jgi:cytochrome c oxidase assembly factor CtaG
MAANALCTLVAVCYWLGGRRPVRLVDASRRWSGRHWRATAFYVGLGMTTVGVSGPADALARQSFSARTAQLMVLLMVVGPLLVLGAPQPRISRLLGLDPRQSGRALWVPVVAFALFNGALLLAYLPGVYRATAEPGVPRQVGQLAMVGLAYLFWSQAIAQPPGHCRLSYLGRVGYLFLSSAQVRILGVVLGFASAPFYPVSLTDQQIAAGIVMVPGVLTDLVVLTVCLYLWLGQDDRRSMRHGDPGGRRRAPLQQRTAVR